MYKHLKNLLFLAIVTFLIAAGTDTLFVQSTKAKIMESPSFRAKIVATAHKGEELTVLGKKGRWYQVSIDGKKGWISRLLVSQTPPMKKVSVFAKADKDISTKARRRASVMTTAAAARGLAEDDRKRLGAETKVDYAAIEKVDAISVSESETDAFIEQIQ